MSHASSSPRQARRPTRTLRVLLLSLATLGAATALAGGTLRRGAFGEPETFQPNQSGVSSEQIILRDLFEGLTSFAADGKVIPGAAESWSASADGLQYRFRLRANLRWSDGHALTAQDFVYGFRRTLTPATTVARATRLYAFRNARAVHTGKAAPETLGVSAADARTLIIQLEYPLPSLPILMAGEEGFPLPQHVIERAGNGWTRAGTMVSNGAFMLAERAPRANVRLRKNPYFHDAAKVQLDEVLYTPSDDTVSLVNRFRANELDVNGWPGFAASRQQALQQELGAAVHVTPLTSVRYLRFNTRRPPFNDAKLRAALSLAVDRDIIARRVMPGGERPSLRSVPAGVPDDQPPANNALGVGTAAARLARSRALLAELAAQGRGLATLGRPIRLRAPSGNGEELCLAVIAMWKQAGVNAVLDQSEIKSMIADLRKGDFDIALTGAQDIPAFEAYLERLRSTATNNTGGYQSPDYDRALDVAEQQRDPRARAAALAQAEAIVLRDHPILPLIQEVARSLVSPNVHGWVDNPYDIHLSRWLSLK